VITANGARVITQFPADQLYVQPVLDRFPAGLLTAGERRSRAVPRPGCRLVVGYPWLKGLM
jgi:hypothetical protein